MTSPTAIRTARENIDGAITRLRAARDALQAGGMSDTADELAREISMLRVFTSPSGLFDALENGADWPDGVPSLGPKMLRQAQGAEVDNG